jgi:hypothetical protein
MGYKIEADFWYKGIRCVVVGQSTGYRCGYCQVNRKHPFYGFSYHQNIPSLMNKLKELKDTKIGKRGIIPVICWDGTTVTPEILIDVHGGITFSGDGKKGYPVKSRGWWFGFDCGHSRDKADLKIMSQEQRDYYRENPEFLWDGVIRTKEYVINECKSMARQLIALKEDTCK